MARTRTLKIKPNPKAQEKQRTRNAFAGGQTGGLPMTIGHTASLSDTLDAEIISKGIFGDDTHSPHYTVVEADISGEPHTSIVPTVFNYRDLLRIFMNSTVLRECVDSIRTNVESYGFDMEYIGPTGQQQSRASLNEQMRLERLLQSLTSDGRDLRQHREDSRIDKEVLGARAFEVIEDAVGRVVSFEHVPMVTLRMTRKDRVPTQIEVPDANGRMTIRSRRFRRFVQTRSDGKRTYFKEFGDPRPIDPKDGSVNPALPIEDQATAIYYDAIYFPGNPCGVPRWVGAIPALLGAREAEMVNLEFFRDNAIPAMAVLVSGGALTEESFEKIEAYISGVRGRQSMNRIVVLEATAEGSDAAAIDGSLPAPRVDLKPMLSERQHEGLFKNYVDEAERKARQAFRLPPVYIGSANDYNRASAFASMMTADQQIFVPERMSFDFMFDRIVMSSHNFRYWRIRSAGPGLTDPQEVARIVNSLGREGAFTPNMAIKLANRFLDADIPLIKEDWGNVPYSATAALIKSGKEVPGLDFFVEVANEQLPPADGEDPNPADPANDNMDPVQKIIRRIADDVSDQLAGQLDEIMQSIAAE